MLKQRILTALVLAPLVIWGILSLPSPVFSLFFGLVIVIGAWEWAGLVSVSSTIFRLVFSAVVAALMYALWLVFLATPQSLDIIYMVALVWWCSAFLGVVFYPAFSKVWGMQIVKIVAGLLVLIPAWLAVTSLHSSPGFGPAYVLFLFILIWSADSGAYFGGKKWGRKKLAPQVSPGKTWEGVLSGMFVVCVFALAAGYFMDMGKGSIAQLMMFVGLSLVTASFSVLGDLTESMFKRQANIKDSGSILPGHGGILDRIDSITSAAPVFLSGLWLFQGKDMQSAIAMHGLLQGLQEIVL